MDDLSSRAARTVNFSRAEQVHIVMPVDVNASYNLFGGMLMQWVDVVAGVVARRHAGREVLTAAIDHLTFMEPAHLNDTVTISGRVTCVGNTSMEVCVDTFVERMEQADEKRLVNRAFLTMVAMDDEGIPTRVPRLVPETDEEKQDYEEGLKRRELRKKERGRWGRGG